MTLSSFLDRTILGPEVSVSGPAQGHDPAQPPDGLLRRVFGAFPGSKQSEYERLPSFLYK